MVTVSSVISGVVDAVGCRDSLAVPDQRQTGDHATHISSQVIAPAQALDNKPFRSQFYFSYQHAASSRSSKSTQPIYQPAKGVSPWSKSSQALAPSHHQRQKNSRIPGLTTDPHCRSITCSAIVFPMLKTQPPTEWQPLARKSLQSRTVQRSPPCFATATCESGRQIVQSREKSANRQKGRDCPGQDHAADTCFADRPPHERAEASLH